MCQLGGKADRGHGPRGPTRGSLCSNYPPSQHTDTPGARARAHLRTGGGMGPGPAGPEEDSPGRTGPGCSAGPHPPGRTPLSPLGCPSNPKSWPWSAFPGFGALKQLRSSGLKVRRARVRGGAWRRPRPFTLYAPPLLLPNLLRLLVTLHPDAQGRGVWAAGRRAQCSSATEPRAFECGGQTPKAAGLGSPGAPAASASPRPHSDLGWVGSGQCAWETNLKRKNGKAWLTSFPLQASLSFASGLQSSQGLREAPTAT